MRARACHHAPAAVLLLAMLLASGAGVALPAPRPALAQDGGAKTPAIEDGAYVAESLWSARAKVGLTRAWWTLRPLWEGEPLGRGVRIGLVDTGIDPTHPDLQGVVERWIDLAGDANGDRHADPYDDHGHGTHVAGILVGRGHLQPSPLSPYWVTGARGIAPEATLLVAKAMRQDGRGEDEVVAAAIDWIVDPDGDGDLSDGADVINLSIGMEPVDADGEAGLLDDLFAADARRGDALATEEAVERAIARGVVVIVSSGNGGADRVTEPGAVRGVIAVGAVDADGGVVGFSNGGAHLDVVAPGVLASAYPRALDTRDGPQDGYVGMAGTSMAAPVVVGVVARMMEADPNLRIKSPEGSGYASVLHLEQTLRETARRIEGVPAERQGWGVVDAEAALKAVDRGGGAHIVNAWGVALIVGAPFAGGALVARPLRALARGRSAKKTPGGDVSGLD